MLFLPVQTAGALTDLKGPGTEYLRELNTVAKGEVTYGERAELLDVQYQEVTKQAGDLTKAAIALITQNPWAAFGLNTAADGIISGEINLENVVKDAAFTYVSGGIQGSSAKFGSQKWLTDTAVRSVKEGGIRTAVYGGSLKDNIAGAATQIAINDATAFVHGKIGDVKENANWGEGSFPGAVLKGAAGCISSDLNGGNCGRGAVLAAGAEFATGFVHDQTGGDTDATAEAMLRYGNPFLAALTSGGDVSQFGINQGIADSQLKNNYLSHPQNLIRANALIELQQCESGENCSAEQIAELTDIVLFWDNVDTELDQQLNTICEANRQSTECRGLIRDAMIANSRLPNGPWDNDGYLMAPARYQDYGAEFSGDPGWDALAARERLHLEEYGSTDVLLAPYGDITKSIARETGFEYILGGAMGFIPARIGKFPGLTTRPAATNGGVRVPRAVGADIPSVPVHNINEFFNSLTGGVFKSASSRTSKTFQGQRVYKANTDITLQDGSKIRKGDQFYLDGLHKNHLEVFDARGRPRIKVDLAGKNLGDLPSDRKLP